MSTRSPKATIPPTRTVDTPAPRRAGTNRSTWLRPPPMNDGVNAGIAESLASFPTGSATREYIGAFVQLFDPVDQPSTDCLRGLVEATIKSRSETGDVRRLQVILNRTMEVIEPFRQEANRFLGDCPQPRRTKPRVTQIIAGDLSWPLGDADIVVTAWDSAVRVIDPHRWGDPAPPPGSAGTCCYEIAREIQQRQRRYKAVAKVPRFSEQADAVAQIVRSIGALSLAADYGVAQHALRPDYGSTTRYAVASLRFIETLLPEGKATTTKVALNVIEEMGTA